MKSTNYTKIILYLKRKEYFLISIKSITRLHLFGVVFYKQTYSTHTYKDMYIRTYTLHRQACTWISIVPYKVVTLKQMLLSLFNNFGCSANEMNNKHMQATHICVCVCEYIDM